MLIATFLLLLAQASPTPIVVRSRPPVVVQQQTPPPVYYQQYGSLARQRIVYQNIQQQDVERQLREYRRFREEVNRQVTYRQPTTVVYERRAILVRVQ